MASRLFVGLLSVLLLAASLNAQSAPQHTVTPLAAARFSVDEDVKCLSDALEAGDPEQGPSTFALKAGPGCVVPWHYHTAEEQLIVVHGQVLTEMEGMPATRLGPGGFASMLSREKHQFTCTGSGECLLFVMFDRIYDIHWVSPRK